MNRVGLLEVFSRLKIRHTGSGKNVSISCPFAPEKHENGFDSKPSMRVLVNSEGDSLVKCFSCGWSSNLLHMVRILNDTTHGHWADVVGFVRDQEIIANCGKLQIPVAVQMAKKPAEPFVSAKSEKELEPYVGKAPTYLIEKRGLEIATLKAWEVGFDAKYHRAVFPVRDGNGALVGMYGRSVKRKEHHHYWNWPKSQYLFGEWKLDPKAERVIVVEGIIDVLRLWQHGFKPPRWNVVALFGSTPSDLQLDKLRRINQRLIIFLDGDKAGREGTKKLVEALYGTLRNGIGMSVATCLDGKDPADLTRDEVFDVIQASKTSSSLL